MALGTAVTADTPVVGTLGQNGQETAVYRFAAAARQRIAVQSDSGTGNRASWRLIDPYGNLVSGPGGPGDSGPLTMIAGTYTLLVEGAISASAPLTYAFTIANVPAQDASGQTTQDFDTAALLPYTLGNTSGTPAALVPGATGKALRLTSGANGDQNNTVFFPLTQDGPLDHVTVDLDFTIKVPQGGGRDGTLLLALLDADTWGNSGIGPDLSTNAGLANSLGISIDVNNRYGGDGSSNHIAIRTGAGLVRQVFVSPLDIDMGAGTPIHATLTVRQADGGSVVSLVLTAQGGSAKTVLDAVFVPGYRPVASRLAIEGRSYFQSITEDIDNVAIAAVAGTSDARAIALGQTVSDSILVVDSTRRYAFDIAAPARVVFDNLAVNPGNITWSLSGPPGGVGGDYFVNSDASNRGGGNVLILVPGHYVLTVGVNFQQTGRYSFRLLDVGAAVAIAAGNVTDQAVPATLDPGNGTVLYKFAGTAKQIVYFDNLDGQPNAYVRLLDPDGQLVTGPNFIDNLGPFTLAKTGTYLLSLEGQYDVTTPQTLRFRLVDEIGRAHV